MGIRLKRAESAQELDDAFEVRRHVYMEEEGKFGVARQCKRLVVDRFDAHPYCANLVAYEGDEAVATIRLNMDTGVGVPAELLCDFSDAKAEIGREWSAPRFGSAGMLAVRKGWRRRRDVIRALFKLAATVARSWGWSHVLITANHENTAMYRRVGFRPVGAKVWVEEIGNHVVPMVAVFADFYSRTVGNRLDDVALLRCFTNEFQRVVLRAGEAVFREEEEADECYVVDVGSVKITTRASDGRELVFATLGPGEIFGEMALIDAKTRSANAIAETDTEVIVLRRDEFMEGLRQHPDRMDIVLGFISDRLRKTDELAKLLAYGSSEQRLEFALKSLLQSNKFADRPDGTGVLKAGPGDLAAAAGADEGEVLGFLDALRRRGLCEYTDTQIRFLQPYTERPHA